MDSLFEELVQGLVEEGYGSTDGLFEPELIEGLRQNLLRRLEAGAMHPAGVGKHFTYQRNLQVRGDLISWLDEHPTDPFERRFLERVEAFVAYLNRTCFTALNGWEFHYARYDTGSFYKRHLDQFRHDRGRRFSLVTYLNPDWSPEDEGQLLLYLPQRTVELLPEAGQVVFFRADQVEHEVRPARRPRLSIAGWLLSLQDPLTT